MKFRTHGKNRKMLLNMMWHTTNESYMCGDENQKKIITRTIFWKTRFKRFNFNRTEETSISNGYSSGFAKNVPGDFLLLWLVNK